MKSKRSKKPKRRTRVLDSERHELERLVDELPDVISREVLLVAAKYVLEAEKFDDMDSLCWHGDDIPNFRLAKLYAELDRLGFVYDPIGVGSWAQSAYYMRELINRKNRG